VTTEKQALELTTSEVKFLLALVKGGAEMVTAYFPDNSPLKGPQALIKKLEAQL
jgi:hypothetical protein